MPNTATMSMRKFVALPVRAVPEIIAIAWSPCLYWINIGYNIDPILFPMLDQYCTNVVCYTRVGWGANPNLGEGEAVGGRGRCRWKERW